MTEIQSIFVYGTLKRGCLREIAWPRKPLSVQAATLRAALYDVGPYPAIGIGDDWVLGEVWTLAVTDLDITLRTLDEVEGYVALGADNEYDRIAARAFLADDSSLEVYTYRFADVARLPSLRRIAPQVTFAGKLCAEWPDGRARVPRSFADE